MKRIVNAINSAFSAAENSVMLLLESTAGTRNRHEHIGLGPKGETGFKTILGCEKIRNLPFILETPIDSRRTI